MMRRRTCAAARRVVRAYSIGGGLARSVVAGTVVMLIARQLVVTYFIRP